MRPHHTLLIRCSLAALVAATPLGNAIAQDTPPDLAAPDVGDGEQSPDAAANEGVIVVTAQRREQLLQLAPAVINVIDGELVDKMQIDSVENLSVYTPGLKVDGNSRDQQRLGLRGAFGSADTPGSGQSVGLYIDGVFYGHTTDLGPVLFDVEQVEVLRGPQGTLYGQSVVGGLINITTRDPKDYLEGEVRATYGKYNQLEVGGRVSGPLGPNLGASISAIHRQSDGWQRNLTTGNRLDAEETFSARGKLVWEPSEGFGVKLIGDYATDNTYGITRNIIFGDPERFVVPDWKSTTKARDGEYDRESYGVALIGDLEFGWATLSSVTSYQHNDSVVLHAPYITDPEAYFDASRVSTTKTLTQELRLAGDVGPLRWQVGGFYYSDDARRVEDFDVSIAPGTALYDFGGRTNLTRQDFDVETENMAVFGEFNYSLAENATFTVGARYTHDKKKGLFNHTGVPDPVIGQLEDPPFTVALEESWNSFTPKATLDAYWTDVGFLDRILIYGTVSKGFKPGGFYGGSTAAGTGSVPPETAWNYEGGFKTTFLSHAANFNVSAFKVDYSNLQTFTISSAGQQGIASTDARAWGVEAEFSVNPLDGLNASIFYAYLNTRIADGATAPNGAAVGGNFLPQSPEHSVNVLLDYSTSIATDVELGLTASYAYKDGVFFDVRNNRSRIPEVFAQSKQSVLDLEASITHGGLQLSVWGKNLLDDKMLLRAFDLSRFTGLTTAERAAGETLLDGVFDDPMTYGVTARYRF